MIVLLFILLSTSSFGWGFLGHQTIARLAEKKLTAVTKEKIAIIQHKEPLTKLSIWPDTIRNYYPHTTSWHFLSIPKIPFTSIAQSSKTGQLEQQLCNNINKLATKSNIHWQERHQALSWVIHLVGDAHQPLHIGNGNDAGGNSCYIKWYKRKKPITLHKAWDTFLVKSLLKNRLKIETNPATMQEISAPPMTWIRESRALHKIIYPKNIHLYCNNLKQIPQLNNQYTKAMLPIVQKRLVIAGERLAFILNYIFDEQFRNDKGILKNWGNCLDKSLQKATISHQ
jgi:hypothetical protein